MKVGLTIHGGRELEAKLQQLDRTTAKKYTRQALRAGAAVIRKEARDNAPVESGQLKRAIRTRAGRTKKGSVSVLVSASSKWYSGDEFYAAFQEFGFKAGRTQVEGKHFLQNAAESKKDEAARVVTERLRELIEGEGK